MTPVVSALGPAWLFVPGDRSDRFDRALDSGADHVILDLEDAVPESRKVSARESAVNWMAGDRRAWVRVNAPTTPWFRDDVEALAGTEGLSGIILPKAENPDDARTARDISGAPQVAALVETARGLRNVYELADSGAIDLLMLGTIDLCLDMGCDESDQALAFARISLVMASRTAELPPPVDGVTVALRDEAGVESAAQLARGLGFGGKLAIHPAQIPPLHRGFQPPELQVAWATRVLQAAEGGASDVDGDMVDAPVVARAAAILSRRQVGTVAS